MSTDLRVIRRGAMDGLPGGMEAIVCSDPDRAGQQIVIIRCKACGRGVVGRPVREGAEWRPDGELVVAHSDETCPVFIVQQAGASGRAS